MDPVKAAVRTKYGPPEVLTIKEVEKPIPAQNEILIRVHATSVNRSDYHVLTGKPFYMRFFTGLAKPRLASTGTDFSGQVEKVGSAVKIFNIGDRVMGFGSVTGIGSHAQYISIDESAGIVQIPSELTYQQAAACLEGAYYAYSPIIHVKLKEGQKALVYGATGAIGSAYLQFLKFYKVSTTAVCNTKDFELVRSLGADRTIDYKKEDFTKDKERYDFILDAVGKSSFQKCKALLKDNGVYTSSGPRLSDLIPMLVTPHLNGKKVLFIPPKDIKTGLMFIKDLIEKGSFRPVIDRVYPLERIVEAYNYVASGEKIGNVILTMES